MCAGPRGAWPPSGPSVAEMGAQRGGCFSLASQLVLGTQSRVGYLSQSWGQRLTLVQGEANGPRGITNSGVTSDFSLH